MKTLKILFVGIGSIAKRHIRNLKSISTNRDIQLRIDAFRHSKGGSIPEGISAVYTDISSVPYDYDIVFITNPTEKHLSTMKTFHERGKNFFIEKPIVSLSQIDEAKRFVIDNNKLYYVACPLRYNAVIQYIRSNIDLSDVISIRSISSSYLPEWRPGQDYRETYSAHKDMGGGVSIDLIHEWDYLTYLFGWPETMHYFIGKKSDLEIDSDDYAVYIAEYADKILELHLDYFGRKTIRSIELFTNNETIKGDIAGNSLYFLKSGRVLDFHENRDDFQKRELEHFIDMVTGKKAPEEGFTHGIKVLELTQGII